VSLTLLEAQPTAVKIARADAKGLTVIVGEGQLPVSWEQLVSRDYLGLALGFAKDDNAFDQVLAGVFLIAEGRGSDGEERLAKALLLDPKAAAWVEEARTLLQPRK
jgi:hypothetical protein